MYGICHITSCKTVLFTGHTVKPLKDDVEKLKSKKTLQSSCLINVIKKDKLNNDLKKHNESNSMLLLFKIVFNYKIVFITLPYRC